MIILPIVRMDCADSGARRFRVNSRGGVKLFLVASLKRSPERDFIQTPFSLFLLLLEMHKNFSPAVAALRSLRVSTDVRGHFSYFHVFFLLFLVRLLIWCPLRSTLAEFISFRLVFHSRAVLYDRGRSDNKQNNNKNPSDRYINKVI